MWSSPGQRRWRYGAALGVETKVPTERGARAGVRTPPSGRPRGLVRSYYEGLPSMAAFNGCLQWLHEAEDRRGESLAEAERA